MSLHLSQKPADEKVMHLAIPKPSIFRVQQKGIILIAAFSIIRSAITRLIEPVPLENLNTGLLFSLLASLVNMVVGIILIKSGKKHKSLILEADGRHLMTDVDFGRGDCRHSGCKIHRMGSD